MTRIACVRVAPFVTAAVERAEPALHDQPLVVVRGTPPTTYVVDANPLARERGLYPGMPYAEAAARCSGLTHRFAAPEVVASARQALLEACLAVAPRLEDADAGVVFVDVAGLRSLYGDDMAVARRLARAAHAVGLPAHVAIASSRAAARVATHVGPRIQVVPSSAEREFLAEIPVGDVELPPGVQSTLARWGITTLGALAALPRAGLATRLGLDGLAAQDLAQGIDRVPFRAWTPPPFWEEAQAVEAEIEHLPPLLDVLHRVLERLCRRLTAAHRAADAIDVRLALVNGAHDTRALMLACPMDDARAISAVVARTLAGSPPPAAVIAVAVNASTVPHLARARGLWQPAAPAARDLATVLARLTALVGSERVGAVVATDIHRPDAWALVPFLPPPDEGGGPLRAPALALRRLRPPRVVEVDTDHGRPVAVRGALSNSAHVVTAAGPWRLSGEWWDTNVWARDEWDVALSDHIVCRLAFDPIEQRWLLDGVYD